MSIFIDTLTSAVTDGIEENCETADEKIEAIERVISSLQFYAKDLAATAVPTGDEDDPRSSHTTIRVTASVTYDYDTRDGLASTVDEAIEDVCSLIDGGISLTDFTVVAVKIKEQLS